MLLINPSISKSSQIELLTKFIYTSFPTSIGFLAGYLRAYNGVTPEIIDEHIRPLSDTQLKSALGRMEVGIVGLSCMTLTISRGIELARKIKEFAPNTLIVMGGIHPTVMPDDCFKSGVVDIVVKGEGEQTLSELYQRVEAGKSYEDLDGIVYKKDDAIVHNQGRALLKNIDDIPEFPYDLFAHDRDKYTDFGTMVTSRGCPFDCIFCSQRAISGKAFRYASIERSLSEIDKLINKYDVKTIYFNEDSFAIHKKRVYELCEGIIERGYHKQAEFIAELRADSTNRELLTKMYEANFTSLACGAETGSERLMKIINKRETVEQNNEFIRLASEIGIKVSTTYIFGFPTETREERKQTFKLSQQLPLDNVRFNTAIPYPGTYIYELAKQENRLNVLDEWKNFNVQYYAMFDDLPYYPKGMAKYELIYDTMIANIRTYVSVRGLTTLLKSPLTGGGVISLPDKWSLSDIYDGVKLALFLSKRFLWVSYKAKIAPIFRNPLVTNPEDAADPKSVAEAMEVASTIYSENVSANKQVKRGAIKNVSKVLEV